MVARMTSRNAPTLRTLQYLAAHGWVADIAERRTGPVTRDLFGCIDIVAVHPREQRTLFVQCTSDNGNGNFAARLTKTLAQTAAVDMLRAGCRVEVWGWRDGAMNARVARLGLVDGRAVVVNEEAAS